MIEKNISLKESILVKDNGPRGVLAMDLEKDLFFRFTGDFAKLMLVLFEEQSRSFTASLLLSKLKKKSVSLNKSRDLQEFQKALLWLKNNDLIDADES